MVIVLALLVVLFFLGIGFVVHLLWIAAFIFLVVWLVGFALGRGGRGRHHFYHWAWRSRPATPRPRWTAAPLIVVPGSLRGRQPAVLRRSRCSHARSRYRNSGQGVQRQPCKTVGAHPGPGSGTDVPTGTIPVIRSAWALIVRSFLRSSSWRSATVVSSSATRSPRRTPPC